MTQASAPLSTVGDFIASGHYHVSGYCWRCRRHPELPLADLAERYGRALAITDLRRRLRCMSCGNPGELTISNAGMGMVAHHGAG
jgi:hypothetical protein